MPPKPPLIKDVIEKERFLVFKTQATLTTNLSKWKKTCILLLSHWKIMSWNASEVTWPMYRSLERKVQRGHFRKSETNQWERKRLPYLVMALVADCGGTHVWVSSPIRACVEGLLGRGEWIKGSW